MKLLNTTYTTKDNFVSFLQTLTLPKDYASILVQVYSGVNDRAIVAEALESISQSLPEAIIIGASTAGEIANGRTFENTIAVSLAIFDCVKLRALFFEEVLLDELSSSSWSPILNDDTKAVIALTSGFHINHGGIIASIPNPNNKIVIGGGVAGDNNRLQESWIFYENKIHNIGVVAVSLSSPSLSVQNAFKFNWVPIGQELTVTECKGNIISKIDGLSIREIYRKYLGLPVANNLPGTSAVFPLVMKKGNLFTSRVMMQTTVDGAGVFTGSFSVGDKLQFAYADYSMLLNNDSISLFTPEQIEVIFVYSCAGRKIILNDNISEEIEPLSRIADNTGFFSYGEFFTLDNGKNEVLNNTMTLLLLSEQSPITVNERRLGIAPFEVESESSFQFTFNDMFHSLTHFTTAITNELIEKNQHLEKISITDNLTQLYNRNKLDYVLDKEIQRAERFDSALGVIVIDVDHFKSVNDRYGHQVGDYVLQAFANLLQESIRSIDIAGRWGGEEFVIICPETRLNGTLKLAHKIRERVESHGFEQVGPKTASFGVAVFKEGDDVNSIIKRADEALYRAKDKGRNRVEF